jgi:hypothetical protein
MTTEAAQIVSLPPGLRFYSIVCRKCLEAAGSGRGLAPVVKGELPEEALSITTSCPCGHPITVVARAGEVPGREETSEPEGTMSYLDARRGRGS